MELPPPPPFANAARPSLAMFPIQSLNVDNISAQVEKIVREVECEGKLVDIEKQVHPLVVKFMNDYCGFVTCFQQPQVVIVYESAYRFYKETEFRKQFANLRFKCQITSLTPTGRRTRKYVEFVLAKIWLVSTMRREFREVGRYYAYQALAPDVLNLYRGLNLDAALCEKYVNMPTEELKKIIDPLMKHLFEVWCRSDKRKTRYLIFYFALLVQQPLLKLLVALVVRSTVEGAGKSIIFGKFGSLFGYHYRHLSREDCFGTFNDQLRDCIFLFIDEYSKHKSDVPKLKRLITELLIPITAKREKTELLLSPNSGGIATNELDAIPAGPGARRYLFLDVDPSHGGIANDEKSEYFKRIRQVPMEAVYVYLCRLDVSKFRPECVLVTHEFRDQIRLNFSPVERWWEACLRAKMILPDGALPFPAANDDKPLELSLVHLFELFSQWKRMKEIRQRTLEEVFVMKLAEMLKLDLHGVTKLRVPTLERARALFCEYLCDAEWLF